MTNYVKANDNAGIMSLVTDPEWRLLYCNELFLRTFLPRRLSVKGLHIFLLENIFDTAAIKTVIPTLENDPTAIVDITTFSRPANDGAIKEIQWEIKNVQDQHGAIIGHSFNGQLLDLELPSKTSTGNADAERSERKYKSLAENVPGAVYEFYFAEGGGSGFKYLSPAIKRMFGISVNDFKRSFDHVVPEDRPRLIRAIEHSRETDRPFYFEGRLVTSNGRIRWHSASSSYSYTDHKKRRIYTGIILDITARKNAEEQVLKSERRFRDVLAKIGDNLWEHDFEKNETHFSSSLVKFAGVTLDEGTTSFDAWWSAIHPDDRWMIAESGAKYRTGEIDHHAWEYRVYHTDGSIRWVLDRGVVIERNEQGLPAKIMGTHKDITERRKLQLMWQEAESKKSKERLEAFITIQERERREISHELHEEVLQILSACKILSYSETNFTTNQFSNELVEKLELAIRKVRTIDDNLNTTTLQVIGLPQAIMEFCKRLDQSSSVHIQFDTEGYQEQTSTLFDISLAIFRIAQEHLSAIVKHTAATEIHVSLVYGQSDIRLSIADNGTILVDLINELYLVLKGSISRAETYNGTAVVTTDETTNSRLFIVTIPIPS